MIILGAREIRRIATWPLVIEAIRDGHRAAKARLGDILLQSAGRSLLVRSAWIEGLGPGLKAASIFPDNPAADPPKPSVQGPVVLFDEDDGSVAAILDGREITQWKTAGDSALGADLLARQGAASLLMVGAGAMAEPLIRAHLSVRPSIGEVAIWNRTRARAEALAERLGDLDARVTLADDLDAALARADLVCAATMASEPLIAGRHLKPGCHLDLVGAFRPDMREADDEALTAGRIFVDSFETTLDHIGELKDPIARGVIARADVLADFYGLVAGKAGRVSDDEITIFKNGGGAHLDVMVSRAIAGHAGPATAAPEGPIETVW